MKHIISTIFIISTLPSLSACLSSNKDFAITVPVSQSKYWAKDQSHKTNKFSVHLLRDSRGNILFEEVFVQGSAIGGDHDSPSQVEKRAKNDMIVKAINDVNGTNVSSEVNINKTQISTGKINYNHEETMQSVISATSGNAKILDDTYCKKINSLEKNTTKVLCQGTVQVPKAELKRISFNN